MTLESTTNPIEQPAKAAPSSQGENIPLSLLGVSTNKSPEGQLARPSDMLSGKALAMDNKLLDQSIAIARTKPVKDSQFASTAVDMTSSLTAAMGGTVTFALARSTAVGKVALPLAMVAGGVLKYGSKSGLEHAFIPEDKRTTSYKDLGWGAVDAVSGVGASAVERVVAARYFTSLGKAELGSAISAPVAEHTGRLLASESLKEGFKASAVRGIAGGTTGSAIWSVPHRTASNWEAIKDDPLSGLTKTAGEVVSDSALGAILGGGLGTTATAAMRYKDIAGKTKALLMPEKDLLRLDNYHINDFHSNTEQLPRIATMVKTLEAKSAQNGVDARFFVPGDIESGRVNFAFTKGGAIENEALMRAGAKELVPGNHAYDAPGGRGDVPRYPAVMEPLLQKYPDVSLIAANLDVSSYDQYQRILKPYVVRTVTQGDKQVKVGTIGLTTEEGAIEALKYQDAALVAERAVRELNAQGVNVINIHSHLGLGEDVKLAQHLISKDLKVAGIFGGHSHDALPRPMWVGPNPSMPKGAGNFEIPIAQAGDSGKWIGEMQQAIRPDGTSHRYQTTGKLHQVGADVPEDPGIRKFLDDNLSEINALKSESYDAIALSPYTVANSRNRETAIGNLMADAINDGLQKRLGDQAPQAVMVHSGGIRADIPANQTLTRLDIANVVMNAGKREGEAKELVKVTLTGQQVKDALEYGLRERATTKPVSLSEKLKSLFSGGQSELVDEPGNFVQTSGLRYAFDVSKPGLTPQGGGQRIVDLQIRNSQGVFEAVKPDQTYTIATRFHPVDKWNKYNIFGQGKTIEQVHQEINAMPLEYSQVDLIGDYIRGKRLDPAIIGAPEGRIVNRSPLEGEGLLKPGRSLTVQPIVAGQARAKESDK